MIIVSESVISQCARSGLPSRRPAGRLGAALLAVAVSLAGCTAVPGEADAVMPGATDAAVTPLVTGAPLETASTSSAVPVYWLGHSNDAVYLYREFLAEAGTDDPLVASLRAMMTQRPDDPDYFSIWSTPSRLGASVSAKNIITVDVSADAFGQSVDRGIAERSLAQLVYTATAAAAMAGLIDASSPVQVSVLVDGHTGYQAFGQVPLDTPLTRTTGFVAPVWIVEPSGTVLSTDGTVPVRGQGISTTGTLSWALHQTQDGQPTTPVASGTVALDQGSNTLGSYELALPSAPGSYQLSVFISDPALPTRELGVDTKLITVAAP